VLDLCWLLRSSTLVYWAKLHHFHTYQDEEMPRHSFPTDLGFYLTDMSSGIAGLLKVAKLWKPRSVTFFTTIFFAKNGLKTKKPSILIGFFVPTLAAPTGVKATERNFFID